MSKKVVVCLAVAYLFAAWLLPQQVMYLPQVGNGTGSGASLRTTFILFNPTDSAIQVRLRLTNDEGQPFLITIADVGTTDEFGPFTLQPGETRVLQSTGTGPLSAGAARVEANGAVGVSAVFSLYDGQGNFLTEAGVGNSEPLSNFVVPVDTQGSFNTGVALFNFGAGDATVTFTLRNADGSIADTRNVTLGAGKHLARFVSGQAELFPAVTNFRGSLEVNSTQPLAAVTLRQNYAPLSFTTLPAVSKTSTQTTFSLPQVANGTDPGTGVTMRTTFLIFNLGNAPANVTFRTRKPDGTDFPVTIDGVANNSANFSRTLAAGASAILQTNGAGPLSVGSAVVTSDAPIGVSGIFSVFQGNAFRTEAGVGISTDHAKFSLPVDITGTFDTGVAFFNPGDAPATVTVRLLDATGNRIGEGIPFTLNPKQQSAKLVTELFPGRTNLRGQLAVESSAPISAITLRQNVAPLSFTTLPVAAGASQGTLPANSPLLARSVTGINGTSNQTVDSNLTPGFRLTGVIGGRISNIFNVFAKDQAGQFYLGSLDHTTGRYTIVVPPGVYTVGICYVPRVTGALNLGTVNFTSAPVTVTGETAFDIPITPPELRTVKGTVSGLTNLPANGGVSIVFTGDQGNTGAVAVLGSDGAYEVRIPDGVYTASLMVTNITTPLQPAMTVYNLAPITVGGAVTANFAVPATSQLTGRVRMANGSAIPANTMVTALAAGSPDTANFTCNPPAGGNTAIAEAGTGNYTILLANARSYNMGVVIPVGTTANAFYNPSRLVENLSGNRIEDFLVPTLPATVTISGKLTDFKGAAVPNAVVSISSQEITSAPGVSFQASALTDANGNYTATVLSGTNYRVDFVPVATVAP